MEASRHDDPEHAARVLESHGDYRVLRRFVPQDAFGVEAEGGPAVGVVVDTETTGTDSRYDEIVELTVLRFEYCATSGRVCRITDVYSSLEEPRRPIPPEATAIHGITDEMVAGRRIDDARVEALLSGATHVIAHNAAFDRPLLERRIPAFAKKSWACSHAQVPWEQEGFSGSKLEYLAWQSGFFFDAHRSEVDCRVLLEVLRRPLPRCGRTALAVMLERAQTPALVLWATGSPFESKDALKMRGYRWDPEQRCWHRRLQREQLGDECAWLRNAVYGGRAAQVDVEVQDATVRFSGRRGVRKPRVV
jgi:DNA polymerase-3 subunit epsilon